MLRGIRAGLVGRGSLDVLHPFPLTPLYFGCVAHPGGSRWHLNQVRITSLSRAAPLHPLQKTPGSAPGGLCFQHSTACCKTQKKGTRRGQFRIALFSCTFAACMAVVCILTSLFLACWPVTSSMYFCFLLPPVYFIGCVGRGHSTGVIHTFGFPVPLLPRWVLLSTLLPQAGAVLGKGWGLVCLCILWSCSCGVQGSRICFVNKV